MIAVQVLALNREQAAGRDAVVGHSGQKKAVVVLYLINEHRGAEGRRARSDAPIPAGMKVVY